MDIVNGVGGLGETEPEQEGRGGVAMRQRHEPLLSHFLSWGLEEAKDKVGEEERATVEMLQSFRCQLLGKCGGEGA